MISLQSFLGQVLWAVEECVYVLVKSSFRNFHFAIVKVSCSAVIF